MALIPGSEDPLEKKMASQYSCLEKSHEERSLVVAESWTRLSNLTRDLAISSVQSLSRVQLFATPWTAAHQASLSITYSWSLLRLMSIESVMPSSHLILCRPLLPSIFPSIRSCPMSQFIASGVQSIGVSASASVLPMNIQD